MKAFSEFLTEKEVPDEKKIDDDKKEKVVDKEDEKENDVDDGPSDEEKEKLLEPVKGSKTMVKTTKDKVEIDPNKNNTFEEGFTLRGFCDFL